MPSFNWVFIGDHTLIPSIPEFDSLKNDLSFQCDFVGPILWNGLSFKKEDWPIPGDNNILVYLGRDKDSSEYSFHEFFEVIKEIAQYNSHLLTAEIPRPSGRG